MGSFLLTTLLLQLGELQRINHPLRMAGPDHTTHVVLDGPGATKLTFVHNWVSAGSAAAQQQPILTADSALASVYVGTIHSAPHTPAGLVKEGYGLLAAYRAYGAQQLLDTVAGEYAAAVVDMQAGDVVLGRRGVAGPPLFWAVESSHFGAATSSATLAQLGFTQLHRVTENSMVRVSLGSGQPLEAKEVPLLPSPAAGRPPSSETSAWEQALEAAVLRLAGSSATPTLSEQALVVGAGAAEEAAGLALRCALSHASVPHTAYTALGSAEAAATNLQDFRMLNAGGERPGAALQQHTLGRRSPRAPGGAVVVSMGAAGYATERAWVDRHCDAFMAVGGGGGGALNATTEALDLSRLAWEARKDGARVMLSACGGGGGVAEVGRLGEECGVVRAVVAAAGLAVRFPFLEPAVLEAWEGLVPEMRSHALAKFVADRSCKFGGADTGAAPLSATAALDAPQQEQPDPPYNRPPITIVRQPSQPAERQQQQQQEQQQQRQATAATGQEPQQQEQGPQWRTEPLLPGEDEGLLRALTEATLLAQGSDLAGAVERLRQALQAYPTSTRHLSMYHKTFMYPNNERSLQLSEDNRHKLLALLHKYTDSDSHAGWQELSRYALASVYGALGRHSDAAFVLSKQVLLPLKPYTPPNQRWRSVAPDARVSIMAVSSEDREELRILRESADVSGVTLHVLGLGRHYPANGQKVLLYVEHLRTLPPDEVVVGVDAYDVLLSPDVHKVPLALAKSPAPVMFTAERSCYPDPELTDLYPQKPEGAVGRFLNSGSFAGRAEDLLRVLEEIAGYAAMPTTCDQRASTKYFLEHPGLATLDYYQDAFVAVAMISSPIEFHPDGRFRIAESGIAPAALHANANWGKIFYPQMVESWRAARRQGHIVTVSPPARFAGIALAREGRTTDAIDAFRAAVVQDPSDADSHYNLGTLLRATGDAVGARAAYEAALVADAGHLNALHNLALALYAEDGRVGDAVGLLRRAHAADPTAARADALSAMENALRDGTRLKVVVEPTMG